MTDATFTGKEIGQASRVNAYRWLFEICQILSTTLCYFLILVERCPGLYCGRIPFGDNNYSECGVS